MKKEEYSIIVSEPWNFESPDGQNIIKGSILNIKSNQCIVFKSNYYLQFDEIKGNILILTSRHYGVDFSNFNDERLAFNGSVLLIEYNEQLNENELLKNTKFVIIGSVKKISGTETLSCPDISLQNDE
jgi:hypothetical protein